MPHKGVRTVKHGKLTWMNLVRPEPKLLEKLRNEHDFHELDMEDCLSDTQRSKIDDYKDYLFIILHVPFYDKRKHQVVSDEIDIFIKSNLIITVHDGTHKPLEKFFASLQSSTKLKKEMMGHGSGFLLYEILDTMYSNAFPMLDALERSVTNLEKEVFNLSSQHDMLKDILNTKKNIITFRRIIAPQRSVIAQIEHKNKKFLPDSLEVYFDDVVDKVEKTWANLENLKELIESLQDTNESIISHTTNNVIKILTVFSVMMLPLTVLTGLYGMNVALPLDNDPAAFLMILIIMFGISSGMLGYFKWKGWI